MIIVDRVINCTQSTQRQWEVGGTLLRDNESKDIKWQAVLPTFLIGADQPQEAVEQYRETFLEIAVKEVREPILAGLHRLHVRAKEVGISAPYHYGDYAEVNVTSDDTTQKWQQVFIHTAERYAGTAKWLIKFVHGWVGEAPLMGRAWCDDAGSGTHIRPSRQAGLDLVIPLQEVLT